MYLRYGTNTKNCCILDTPQPSTFQYIIILSLPKGNTCTATSALPGLSEPKVRFFPGGEAEAEEAVRRRAGAALAGGAARRVQPAAARRQHPRRDGAAQGRDGGRRRRRRRSLHALQVEGAAAEEGRGGGGGGGDCAEEEVPRGGGAGGHLSRGRFRVRVRGRRRRRRLLPTVGGQTVTDSISLLRSAAGPVARGKGAPRTLQEPQGVHTVHPPDAQGGQEGKEQSY